MAWRLLNNPDSNNGNNTLVTIADWGACCEPAEDTLATCVITGHNATSNPLDTITIDAVDYDFPAAATAALLYSGIAAAMEEAGYFDVEGNGTLITGAASSLYIAVTTTATVTKLVTTGDSNVTFTCS